MKIELVKGQRQIVPFNQLTDLEDPDGEKGEKLKFELSNHDAVHEGAIPTYTATGKDGRVYSATFDSNSMRVSVSAHPTDPFAKQRKEDVDRNPFVSGKQTPDKYAKTDEEAFAEFGDVELEAEEDKGKKGGKKK